MSLRLSDPRDLDCCCARSFVLMLLNPKSYRLGTGSENPQSSLASSSSSSSPLRIPTLFSASFSCSMYFEFLESKSKFTFKLTSASDPLTELIKESF